VNGGWQPWWVISDKGETPVAASSWGGGRLDVFKNQTTVTYYPLTTVWHRTPDGNWGSLGTIGDSRSYGPAAMSWGANRIDLFVRDGSDGHLAHRWYS
jgi:hypothetical protein